MARRAGAACSCFFQQLVDLQVDLFNIRDESGTIGEVARSQNELIFRFVEDSLPLPVRGFVGWAGCGQESPIFHPVPASSAKRRAIHDIVCPVGMWQAFS